MTYRLPLTLVLATGLLIAASLPTRAAQGSRLSVVASFSILADIAENVGGDRVQVRALVGRNADMHVYEPTLADARALRDATVFLEIGQGFEPRLAGLYRASGSRAARVTVTDGMTLRGSDPNDAHRHGPNDPHVWHDIANAVHITYAVRDAFVQADPAGRDAYFLNAAVFAENFTGSRLMERVAEEAGVTLARLYTDALGPPGSGADTYYGLIRTNVTTIVAALGQ